MRRVILALFGTVTGLVVLLGYKTHSPTVARLPAAVSTTGPADMTTTPDTAAKSTGPAAAAKGSTSSSSATKTVTGDSVDTRWGPVQVQITVANGKITAAQAVVYPTGNSRDQEINSYAIPALNQEAVAVGSAQIDTISGATVTSDGYLGSLQSALDKAGV